MKIAICTDNFYPTSRGTENAVHNIANSLVSLGNEVYVFACMKGKNSEEGGYLYRVERAYSLPVFYDEQINFPKISHHFKKTFYSFSPDIVHAHTPFNIGLFGINYAKKNNIPSVLTIHTKFKYSYDLHVSFNNNNVIHKMIVKALMNPIKKSAKNAECITTVSKSAIDEEISTYGVNKNVIVIRNGYKVSENPREHNTSNSFSNTINLCFTGNISREKNIGFILNVCKILTDRKVPYRLNLFGMCIEESYKTMVKEMNISSNVHFRGKLPQKELFDLYADEDIFLFPSIFDNDSLAAIEARAKGVITLAIKNTGSSERVRDGIDGFCLNNSPLVFADKIQELYTMKFSHPEEFLALKNNAKEQKVLSWDEIAKQYLNLYNNLLKNKKF